MAKQAVQIDAAPQIAEMELRRLHRLPGNPREMARSAKTALLHSLKRFGYTDLLVVNTRTMNVVSGNQRLSLLLEAGIESAPVITVDLDDADEKTLAITLNSDQLTGRWTAALTPLLDRLRAELPEGDFLDLRLAELRAEVAAMEPPFILPPPAPIPTTPQTQPGELVQIGRHRVIAGDCANGDDVDRLFNGRDVPLLTYLQPFARPVLGEHRSLGAIQQTAGPVYGCRASTELTVAEWNQLRGWKLLPEAYPSISNRLATEIVTMIGWAFAASTVPRGIDFIITTPPRGASAASGRTHAAGALAREIATRLDRDFVTVFSPIAHKTRHGKFASLEAEAFTVERQPDRLAILIDDVSTSGRTMQKCREALAATGTLAFCWLFFHGELQPVTTGSGGAVYDPYLGTGDVLFQAELAGRTCYGFASPGEADAILSRWESWQNARSKRC